MELSPLSSRTFSRIAAGRQLFTILALAMLAVWAASAIGQENVPPPRDAAQVAADVATGEADAPNVGWDGLMKAGIVIALLIVPIIIGNYLAKQLRMPDHGWKFALAIGSLAAAAVAVSTGEIKLGPDLSGGITLIYELQELSDGDDGPVAAASDDEVDADADEAAADGDAAKDVDAEEPTEEEAEADDAGKASNPYAGMDRDERMALMIKALTKRVDPSGTKEVSIKKFGDGQIEIIIPKAEKRELESIERQISTSGALEFRITASRQFEAHRHIIEIAEQVPAGQNIVRQPDGTAVARWVEFNKTQYGSLEDATELHGLVTRMSGDTPQALVMTDDGLDVTGQYLRRAMADFDQNGNPAVSFIFNTQGAFKFGQLTGTHLPNQSGARYSLGILLDSVLQSSPTLRTKISDQGIIEGSMSQEEVDELVGILNAGSLPAALNKTPISRAQISPTLGQLTVEQGQRALYISLVLVAIFMALYYRFAGFVSWLGLAANMLLIVGSMVLIKGAFTMPGLAGLVLTVGMSVDANVLIYERIREELARGAGLRMAIRNGFSRASTAIFDSNITNLITGIVIYKIAPDSVKGFGVTLVLGILMSVYTAVFLTRIVFDVAERRGWIKSLPMRQLIGETHVDFLSLRWACITGSAIFIAVGLAAAFNRGSDLFDIDFTGGSSITMVLKEDKKMSFAEVNEVLQKSPLAASNLSLVEVNDTDTQYRVTTINDDVVEVESILAKEFGDRLETYHVDVIDVTTLPGNAPAAGTNATSQVRPSLPGLLSPLSYVSLLQQAEPATEESAEPAEPETPASEPVAEPAAEPAGEAAETAPAAKEDAPAAEPAAEAPAAVEPVSESPAAATAADAFVGGTSAKLKFAETGEDASGVSYDSLERMVEDALKAAGHVDDKQRVTVAYQISNPDYQSGSIRPYELWDVKLALPADQAGVVFEKLAAATNSQPIFPLSNKIGSRVAGRMAADAIAAIVLCLAGIIAYVWFRFHGVIYGLAAVAALIHDVLVALGVVAMSSYFVDFADPLADALLVEKFQINLTLVAAFLTIIGYSLNDTIVIFDRIREVKGKSPRLTAEMINLSVNQTLARTILTSLTTVTSTIVLYIFGGAGIHAFAFTLLVGFIAGCYSTIFIANPVLMWLSDRAEAAAAKTSARAA